jgi:hypothetical protein
MAATNFDIIRKLLKTQELKIEIKKIDKLSFDYYIFVNDHVILYDPLKDIESQIITYIGTLPRLDKENYLNFLNRSESENVIISYSDLERHNIKLVNGPTIMIDGVVLSVQTRLLEANNITDEALSYFKFLYSYEELRYEHTTKFKIRGIAKEEFNQ